MNKEKELLFSVTKDEFDWEYFPPGGNGGQHANKNSTACRVTHKPSGASGVSRVYRSQLQNRQAALRSLSQTPAFKKWIRIESARRLGQEYTEDAPRDANTSRVRSYDLCERRVTDHKTGIKTSAVDDVLNGKLDTFINAAIEQQIETE